MAGQPTPPADIQAYGTLAKTLWFVGAALQIVGGVVIGILGGQMLGLETVTIGGGVITVGVLAHAVYDH